MNKVISSAFLFFAFAFPALSQETGSSDESEQVPFTTIEQGQASRFIEDSLDVQHVFNDPEKWKSFWEAYTEGREPRPELPYVDFNSEMVVVSSLGNISGVYVDRSQGILRVTTVGNTPSDSPAKATTPFHIIKTEKLELKSVAFEHPNPAKGAVTGEETSEGADLDATATPDAQTQELNAQPPPSCYQFWRHSGHTDRVRWYHCHSTSSAYTKRVHICGNSGYLHGISVASLPDGVWLRARHRHDRGGEGCRRH